MPVLPVAFVPDPPRPAWWQRVVWLASRSGRARLRLANVYRRGPSPRSRTEAKALLERLRGAAPQAGEPGRRLVDELLVYLAWASLRTGHLTECGGWLTALDAQGVDGAVRLALRWELMTRWREVGRDDAYLDEARRLIAGARSPASLGAVQAALDLICVRHAPSVLLGLLDALPAPFAASAWALACRAVCACPERFADTAEAQAWAARTPPAELRFSPPLQAAALVVAARAAEWAGRIEAMRSFAEAAMALDPQRDAVRYWRQRAALHAPVAPADAGGPGDTDTPAWRRLRALWALRRRPDTAQAQASLDGFGAGPGGRTAADRLEAPERERVLVLLRPALSADAGWDDATLAAVAMLGRRVAELFGPQPWAEAGIALAQLRLDADYPAAAARLAAWSGHDLPDLEPLIRVARVLTGAGEPDGAAAPLLEGAVVVDGIEACWFDTIPALRAAREVCALARGVVDGAADAAQALGRYELPTEAPDWVRWLLLRSCLLALEPDELLASLARNDLPGPAAARGVGRWVAEVLPTDLLRQATIVALCAAQDDSVSLGTAVERTLAAEQALEHRYRAARQDLAQGRAEAAAAGFDALLHSATDLCPLARAFWVPLLRYGCGVALAQCHDASAQQLLGAAVQTWLHARARAQLALLALKRGELDRAEDWLHDLADRHAAVLYARALLFARRGDERSALALLAGERSDAGQGASPYRQAGRRLCAALHERGGRSDEAIAAQRAALAAEPDDEVATARGLRLLLRDAYRSGSAAGPEVASLAQRFGRPSAKVPWAHRHAAVAGLLEADGGAAAADPARLPDTAATAAARPAWLQLGTRALLRAGRVPEAARLMAAGDELAAPPDWFARSRLILRAHQGLAGLWAPSGAPSADVGGLRTLAAELAGLCERRGDDAELARWRALTDSAVQFVDTGAAQLGAHAWERLRPAAPGWLPALFTGDEATRLRAAAALLEGLGEAGTVWDAAQRDLAAALAHRVRSDHDALLDCYRRLVPRLAVLPTAGSRLWLAAAAASWYRNKGGAELLEAELPECVADLADPQVRLVLGCAYAQAAADDFDAGELTRSRRRAQTARQTLEPLHG